MQAENDGDQKMNPEILPAPTFGDLKPCPIFFMNDNLMNANMIIVFNPKDEEDIGRIEKEDIEILFMTDKCTKIQNETSIKPNKSHTYNVIEKGLWSAIFEGKTFITKCTRLEQMEKIFLEFDNITSVLISFDVLKKLPKKYPASMETKFETTNTNSNEISLNSKFEMFLKALKENVPEYVESDYTTFFYHENSIKIDISPREIALDNPMTYEKCRHIYEKNYYIGKKIYEFLKKYSIDSSDHAFRLVEPVYITNMFYSICRDKNGIPTLWHSMELELDMRLLRPNGYFSPAKKIGNFSHPDIIDGYVVYELYLALDDKENTE